MMHNNKQDKNRQELHNTGNISDKLTIRDMKKCYKNKYDMSVFFKNDRAVQFCAGMCKSLQYEV